MSDAALWRETVRHATVHDSECFCGAGNPCRCGHRVIGLTGLVLADLYAARRARHLPDGWPFRRVTAANIPD